MPFFIITLRYLAPPAKLAPAAAAHDAYLDKHFKAGTILASGIQTPPIGETLIATARSRNAIERVVSTDPYVTKKWATVDIMEFSANRFKKQWSQK
jgi:uncharacterized protein YciI